MRELTDHKVNECNEALIIQVLDEPGAGGACHDYQILGYVPQANAGKEAYEAYCAAVGGVSYNGEALPTWDEMADPLVPGDPRRAKIVSAWNAATAASAIRFQNGPIKEVGVNGITQEALLAIVMDRLRSFQAGPYACRENAVALTYIETAQMWLQKRTRDRLARGVESTHQK
jgi:hypothetical protein